MSQSGDSDPSISRDYLTEGCSSHCHDTHFYEDSFVYSSRGSRSSERVNPFNLLMVI